MQAFISYAHTDQKYFDRLIKHMAMLMRDGLIEAWSDHKILPGSKIGQEIDENLASSQLFLALVSPDYLSSNYCYEKEFQRALALAESGKLRLVAIILEPCDWLSSPFSQYLCLPKDGRSIAEWTNDNIAYLDVVKGIRRVLEDYPKSGTLKTGLGSKTMTSGLTSLQKIRVRQEFDSIQKRDFADQAFSTMREYFRASCSEINGIEDLKARFEDMGDSAFTCTVVNRALLRGRGESNITVRNDKGQRGSAEILYVFEAHGRGGSSNGSIRVEADNYNLYLALNNLFGGNDHKYDARQVAEMVWVDFVKQAGIEVDNG